MAINQHHRSEEENWEAIRSLDSPKSFFEFIHPIDMGRAAPTLEKIRGIEAREISSGIVLSLKEWKQLGRREFRVKSREKK